MKFFAVIILFCGIVGLIAPAEGSSYTEIETPTTTTSAPPAELPCGPSGPWGQAPSRPCAGGIAGGKKLYFFF